LLSAGLALSAGTRQFLSARSRVWDAAPAGDLRRYGWAFALPGVFITPHVAASTPVSRQRAARLVREQAEACLRGEPLRNVISGAY
jgi:phosphoglycerate dehydrogenase-like enzyme